MDFPAEATVHLNKFRNESEVRKILRSHGLELTDQRYDEIRVKGSFLKLKAAKASLDQLLYLQTETETQLPASPPVSSGAISKYYNTNGERGPTGSRNKPSPSSTPTALYETPSKIRSVSPEYKDARRDVSSSGADLRGSFRPGKESFPVDADVWEYAKHLKKKDIDLILCSHNVIMDVSDVTEESCCVTLMGKSAKTAGSKLQSLLNELNKSLRTQEVKLTDMDPGGRALWERIDRNGHIYNSVLVCQRNNRLHLIGSSRESYELKQRLLGNSVEHSGRTGRTLDKTSRQRSSSLPPINRRGTDRDKGANLSPAGAAGYSPTKYQDVKQNRFELERVPAAGSRLSKMFRRRSTSEPRKKPQPEQIRNGYGLETEKKVQPDKSPKKGLKQLLNVNAGNIAQTFRKLHSNKKKK